MPAASATFPMHTDTRGKAFSSSSSSPGWRGHRVWQARRCHRDGKYLARQTWAGGSAWTYPQDTLQHAAMPLISEDARPRLILQLVLPPSPIEGGVLAGLLPNFVVVQSRATPFPPRADATTHCPQDTSR